jgi:hypothetical protein
MDIATQMIALNAQDFPTTLASSAVTIYQPLNVVTPTSTKLTVPM